MMAFILTELQCGGAPSITGEQVKIRIRSSRVANLDPGQRSRRDIDRSLERAWGMILHTRICRIHR